MKTEAEQIEELMAQMAQNSAEVQELVGKNVGSAGELLDILKEKFGAEVYSEAMGHVSKYKEYKSDEQHTAAEDYLKKVNKDYGG